MDIRCPSCSTLYEFEEDKIGPRGVNVRCSACGQVFKVRRAVSPVSERWVVKRESTGEKIDFDDLSTLQRWIVEQKVSRRDLISKTGDTWRSLGSINELTAFFKVVDELNEPRNASRETDGYLTASQRAPGAESEGRGRGYTPTPSSQPAATRLMAGLDADTATPPTSKAVTASAGEGASSTSPLQRSRTDSKPVPVARPGEPTPSSVTNADYSMGGDDFWDEAPAISFAAPAIDEGRSSDYTSEYSDLRRGSRRWPTVLLALLMLLAGVLLIMMAFNKDSDEEPAGDPLVTDDGSGGGETAAGGSGLVVDGSGLAEGSGEPANGSGAAVEADTGSSAQAEADTGAAEEAAVEADTGAQVAVAERDTRREPTPERDTRREPIPRPDTRVEREPDPEPPPRRDTRPPPREDPPEENNAGGGYDGLMSAGNDSLRAGDYQNALNHFSNATDARPNSAEAHVGVARSYEAMGRHDLAAVRYERATNVNSRYTPAWLGLAEARRTSGDTSGACDAYARVLSIVRTGRSAERARGRIEDLGCE